jgi:outer membrane biosynthesis protein TonB
MTRPDDDRTVAQPVVETPSVSTAPPPSRPHRWWSSIPSHLGKARTSTVIMSTLFLALGALYLNVRPDPVQPAGTTGSTVETTAPARTTAPPATTAPETTASVPTTTEAPTTTEELPTTTEPPVETTEPTEPTPEPTLSDEPTETTVGPTPPPEPGTVSPPG